MEVNTAQAITALWSKSAKGIWIILSTLWKQRMKTNIYYTRKKDLCLADRCVKSLTPELSMLHKSTTPHSPIHEQRASENIFDPTFKETRSINRTVNRRIKISTYNKPETRKLKHYFSNLKKKLFSKTFGAYKEIKAISVCSMWTLATAILPLLSDQLCISLNWRLRRQITATPFDLFWAEEWAITLTKSIR